MNSEIKELLHTKLEFIDPVPQALLCMICNDIMVDSTSIPCGCEFCKECLENYFKNNEKLCPCRDEMHPSSESKFEFQRDSVRSHQTNSKILRLKVKCETCKKVKSVEKMSKHIYECYNGIRKCLFNNVGCNKRLYSDDLSNHMIEDIMSHNQIMLDMFNNLKNEQHTIKNTIHNLNEENRQLKNVIRVCHSKIDSISEENRQIKDEVRIFRAEIDSISEENRNLKCKIEVLESKMQQTDKHDNKFKENILMNHNFLKNRIDTLYQNNGPIMNEIKLINQYTWTIKDLPNELDRDLSLFSDSFYTHKSGYRIRLRFTTTKRSYDNFGIGFQIMKGEYDDGLYWPMKREIKLSIFNKDVKEDEIDEYKRHIIHTFLVQNCKDCFGKPIDETYRKCLNGCNYNSFSNTLVGNVKHQPINNGKIIIKSVVCHPDLKISMLF